MTAKVAKIIDIRSRQGNEPIEGACRRVRADVTNLILPDTHTPETRMLAKYLLKRLEEAIGKLEHLEQRALCLHLGIGEDTALEWAAIGKKLGVSPERASLLAAKAMRKLRRGVLNRKMFDEDDRKLLQESVLDEFRKVC